MANTHSNTAVRTEQLKDAFSVQKVPLASNFSDLIDLADIGRKAAGLSPDRSPGQGHGMLLDGDGKLAVLPQPACGITVSSAGVGVRLEGDKGLEVSGSGIAVKPGTGITVSDTGVNIDNTQLLAPGMIMMFSGTIAPAGWAFCDGQLGRPNLINRFILGGMGGDIGGQSTATTTGTKDQKQYTATNSSATPGIRVTVNDTTLTENQIPRHYHTGGTRIQDAYSWVRDISQYGALNLGYISGVSLNYSQCPTGHGSALSHTSTTGGGAGHKHTASGNQDAHTHTTTITTPYYILAFIIKL